MKIQASQYILSSRISQGNYLQSPREEATPEYVNVWCNAKNQLVMAVCTKCSRNATGLRTTFGLEYLNNYVLLKTNIMVKEVHEVNCYIIFRYIYL